MRGPQPVTQRAATATDSLTGPCNRRAVADRVRDKWCRAVRYGSRLALLLVDIDGLKRINDRLGHRAGDNLLRRTANAIRHSLQASDVGARWGGDELAILAPQTSPEVARQLANGSWCSLGKAAIPCMRRFLRRWVSPFSARRARDRRSGHIDARGRPGPIPCESWRTRSGEGRVTGSPGTGYRATPVT
jgi:diguanylate cyclase (GGDEF)-like protein